MAALACLAEAELVQSATLGRVTVSTVAAQSMRNGVDTAKLFATLDAVKAVRKINLESVESRVEGDIDLRGIPGLSGEVQAVARPSDSASRDREGT